MICKEKFWIFTTIIFQLLICSYGTRTKELMYEQITSISSCFRRTNATHQIGCTSKRGGSTGIVHYCDTEEDLNFILENGKAGNYIPVLPSKLFNHNNVHKMINSTIVSGLIVHSNNETLKDFTHDRQCPNELSNIPNTCGNDKPTWNPKGTAMLYMDIPFPIFYVENQDEIVKIKDCFNKFNNFSYDSQAERSLCSLQLNSFMFATTDTPTCRRRSNIATNLNPTKFCDPMGDNNVWAPLFPLVSGTREDPKPIRDVKYIVIAARMDTTSMFELTAGADSPVTGLVTLLTTAKYLKTILPTSNNYKQNVLFIIFNGETYDYIGSQRLLYDMQQDSFPTKIKDDENAILPLIRPENISLFIELSQLSKNTVFTHYLRDNQQITEFISKLKQYSVNGLSITSVSDSLPPASLHTFLKNLTNLPGVLLADHQNEYVNHFYNSIYDTSSNIGYKYYNCSTEEEGENIPNDSVQRFASNIATAVSKSVFELVTGSPYGGNETIDVVLVDELFYCYLESPNCRVNKAIQKRKYQNQPLSLYVGVNHAGNMVRTLTALTLAWFTGDFEGEYNTSCANIPRNYAYRYYSMGKSIYEPDENMCVRSSMNRTIAVSPAFEIKDYDWSSGVYSTWAESTWADINARMFLRPSSAHENLTIAMGSLTFIFSIIIVYFVKSRSHILFTTSVPCEVVPTDC